MKGVQSKEAPFPYEIKLTVLDLNNVFLSLGADYLKVVSTTFLLVCFLNLNESTCQTREDVFISLQKLFRFLRKSSFRILHFQIL